VAPAPKATTERARPVVAYLPLSLKNRLKATRDRDGLSYTLVVLTAVDAVKDRLVDRWQASRPQGSSFVGWKRARQQHAEPLVPITLRLVAEDEDTLDGIWRAAEAPNRSAYIAAALEEYLA
jgi:hypothetical protein